MRGGNTHQLRDSDDRRLGLAGSSWRAGRQRRPARLSDLAQLAVQDNDGTLSVPFHDPRRPNVVLPPAPIAPL